MAKKLAWLLGPGIYREKGSARLRVEPSKIRLLANSAGLGITDDEGETLVQEACRAVYDMLLGTEGWDEVEYYACDDDGTEHYHARPLKGGKEVPYARGQRH